MYPSLLQGKSSKTFLQMHSYERVFKCDWKNVTSSAAENGNGMKKMQEIWQLSWLNVCLDLHVLQNNPMF